MSAQCDGKRQPACRRPFTPEEDVKLMEIMRTFPFTSWEAVSQQMHDRSSRQCRERWVNYLSPAIRNEPWTEMEDHLLLEKINELGRCWSTIGHFFNGRSENDVKNRWYSHLRYRTVPDEATGKFQFVTDPAQAPFPERKKRNRAKVSPKQNALRMMGQLQMPAIVPQFRVYVEPQMLVEPFVIEQVPDAIPEPISLEIVDSQWDKNLLDPTEEKMFDEMFGETMADSWN